MKTSINAANSGTFTLGDEIVVNRMGFGAMQLAGPRAFGERTDGDPGVEVLKEALALGVNHIDTSDYYGPFIVNDLIREALYPYPDDLVLVSKIGAWRNEQGEWLHSQEPDFLRRSVFDNLERLRREKIDIVNMRFAEPKGSTATPLKVMRALQDEGVIGHIGVSNVSHEMVRESRDNANIICVQNMYNLAHRHDDPLIDELAEAGIAYVPFFPLGGFSPLQTDALGSVAKDIGASKQAVALAWLLQRSPNILLIPGTGSIAHLRANVAAGSLSLTDNQLAKLDKIGEANGHG